VPGVAGEVHHREGPPASGVFERPAHPDAITTFAVIEELGRIYDLPCHRPERYGRPRTRPGEPSWLRLLALGHVVSASEQRGVERLLRGVEQIGHVDVECLEDVRDPLTR
jgi:hypothetical protein